MRSDIEARSRLLSEEVRAIGCVEDGQFMVQVAKGFKLLDAREGVLEDFLSFQGRCEWFFPSKETLSFVESPPRSLATYRKGQAQAVNRLQLPANVVAACRCGPALAALVLETGQLRFVDLLEGKAAGKGTKLHWVESCAPEMFVEPLAESQVLVVRQLLGTARLHYYVVDFEDGHARASSGVLRLAKAQRLTALCAGRNGQVLLQLREAVNNGFVNTERSETYVLANVFRKHKVICSWTRPGRQLMRSMGEYFVECSEQRLRLRLLRQGLAVASCEKAVPGKGPVKLAASEHFTVSCLGGTVLCTRWVAPSFALSAVLGRGCGLVLQNPAPMEPSRAQVAALIRSLERASEPEKELRQRLRGEELERVLQLVILWLNFRRDLSRSELARLAPGLPSVPQMVHFLQLVADVFSGTLMKLPTDLLQKVVERVVTCQKEAWCNEELFVRAASMCCERLAKRPKLSNGPVEVTTLDF